MYFLSMCLNFASGCGMRTRLGIFGIPMEVTSILRLGKGIQIKGSLMGKLGHVDLFAQKRVIENKIKEII
jgi:hypothetical protein